MIDYSASAQTETWQNIPVNPGWTGVVKRMDQAPTALVQISDGTSNTMMVGEKNLCSPKLNSRNDICDNQGYTCGSPAIMRFTGTSSRFPDNVRGTLVSAYT